MNSLKIPINQALTDSLSLKIPLDECFIIDKRLTSQTCIYYESLDAIDDELLPPKPIIIQKNGITVRISLQEIPIYNSETNERTPTKFIQLTLSSKLLKQRYFEGITKNNVLTLYNEFINFNVFRCSFDSFLNGHISDIDVCLNLYVQHPNHYLDALKLLIVDSGTKAKYTHLINKPENLGLTFNKRQFAKPSLPFIKLYHKEYELYTKSTEFYNTYLYPTYSNQIKNLTRIEATIKNYNHKKRLERFKVLNEFRTLKQFLELPTEQLHNFIIFSLKSYIEPQFRVKSPELPPTDFLLFQLIQTLLQNGFDEKSILNHVESFKGSSPEVEQVSKSRLRRKIKELIGLIIFTDEKIQSKVNYNNHVLEYLRQLQIKV